MHWWRSFYLNDNDDDNYNWGGRDAAFIVLKRQFIVNLNIYDFIILGKNGERIITKIITLLQPLRENNLEY